MVKGIATVLEKAYPEQAIIASLTCLRLIGEQFPKNLSVYFGKKDFAFAKNAFEEWYEKVKDRLPAEHRDAILANAKKEFTLFEDRILKKYGGTGEA
jgi:hypothetical protein